MDTNRLYFPKLVQQYSPSSALLQCALATPPSHCVPTALNLGWPWDCFDQQNTAKVNVPIPGTALYFPGSSRSPTNIKKCCYPETNILRECQAMWRGSGGGATWRKRGLWAPTPPPPTRHQTCEWRSHLENGSSQPLATQEILSWVLPKILTHKILSKIKWFFQVTKFWGDLLYVNR